MSSSPPFTHLTSRRTLLRGSAVGAAGLAALSVGVPRIVSAQTAAPWLGGDIPPTSRSSQQMAVAARAFLDTLSSDQLAIVQYPDLGDATRTKWTNFPGRRCAAPRSGTRRYERCAAHESPRPAARLDQQPGLSQDDRRDPCRSSARRDRGQQLVVQRGVLLEDGVRQSRRRDLGVDDHGPPHECHVHGRGRSHRVHADVHRVAAAHDPFRPERGLARAATGRVASERTAGVNHERSTGRGDSRHPGTRRRDCRTWSPDGLELIPGHSRWPTRCLAAALGGGPCHAKCMSLHVC
jgi:hypothetical protein